MADASALTLPPGIELFALEAAEAAAIAASDLTGRGDNDAADQAAVDHMRRLLNLSPIRGRVVIGEGERDEAPMLYIGEEVGTGQGPEVDIALDPLEGTTITAKAMPGALAVLAFAAKGGFLNAPDVYMQKIAAGPGIPEGVIDLDRPVGDVLADLAEIRERPVRDLTVCILERDRHNDLIAQVRASGARIQLIGDGDVGGVIQTALAESVVDLYVGSGGAPEGVLAAAALRCIGGAFQGRLQFRNEAERERARRWGVTDFDRKYGLEDLARGTVIFVATGVTDGPLLSGINRQGDRIESQSLIMRSDTRTVRLITTERPAAEA